MYQYIIGAEQLTENGLYCADYNRDGVINFADVSALYKFMIG